jgi:glutamyl-tRNA reductase
MSDLSIEHLAILGATYRAVPTAERATLAIASTEALMEACIRGGHASGIVCVSTCSRVEWIISASHPEWALQVLEAQLVGQHAERPKLHRRTGEFAARYLFCVASGLDSAVEGESAVARQVLDAFKTAHEHSRVDPLLALVWKRIGRLAHEKRQGGDFAGLERVVADRAARVREPIALFGRGDIGRKLADALKSAGREVSVYRRKDLNGFMEHAQKTPLVVVASGAKAPWLELPERDGSPLCVDLGSPVQTKTAPGWRTETLDVLLDEGMSLDRTRRAALVSLVDDAYAELTSDVRATGRHSVLASIDELRRTWLADRMWPLLDRIPDTGARLSVEKEIKSFAHEILVRARDGGEE